MSFRIIGTGRAHPEYVLTNDKLSEFLDTDDEWITTRTGISTRYIATDETLTGIGTLAGKRAIEKAGIKPTDLDLIICSTIRAEYACPSMACLVQREIGADCPAYDINAACTGFLYALEMADAFIASGKAQNVLVICAELMSRHLDWADRATCVLFGDGAGAAVLQKGDGLKSIRVTAKGDDELLVVGNPFCDSPFYTGPERAPEVYMNGGEVFKFAVGAILKDVRHVMKQAGVKQEDVKMMVPHQANDRIIDFARQKLGFREDQVASGIDHWGNTSSASIPLLLDELIEEGRIKTGDLLVMTAFGGGLTTGACVIEL
ncbi:MAG TPA: ketoacyl-ACP synthase III [Clostridiales bacterium]|jgi:3-oxoacyl-[acyl-carrier-protein] synthase-3|nr:ketoacyl-ACP synthase III [Clostridiales bacterium]